MKFTSIIAAMAVVGANAERAFTQIRLDDLQANKGYLELKAETDVKVTVFENESTPYWWQITKNTCGKRFVLTKTTYHEKNTAALGAPGRHEWDFATPDATTDYVKDVPCLVEFEMVKPDQEHTKKASYDKQLTVVVG